MFNESVLLLDDALLQKSSCFHLLLIRHWHNDISQGSVATHLRCGGIFSDSIIAQCSPDSDSEKSLKIGQYLMKF